MVVLLYLMTTTFWEIRNSVEKLSNPQFPLLKMSFWFFLFGVLLEWKALNNIVQGNLKVNWLIVPGILLTLISFIPRIYWSFWFGSGKPFYLEMLEIAEIQSLLTVLAGILLVRSFNKE